MRAAIGSLLLAAAGCAGIDAWQRWDASEQKRYFGLTFVAPDSVVAPYRQLSDRGSRDSLYRAYWERTDPSGVALAEHQRRLDHAWEEFGGQLFFRDDRSRAWVQFGKPDNRSIHQPYLQALGTQRLAGGTYYKEQGWEIWEYPLQGVYFDFLQDGDCFRTGAAGYSDRRHPVAVFQRLDSVPGLRPSPIATGNGTETAIDGHQCRFKSDSTGRVRWEIFWRLPVGQALGRTFQAEFALSGPKGPTRVDTVFYDVTQPRDSLREPFAYGQRNLDLKPGPYSLELLLTDLSAGLRYRWSAAAELVEYLPSIQEASDVELSVLQDTTFASEDFRKGGFRRIVPMVVRRISPRQPFFVYYEAYNLHAGPGGRHSAKVGFQIFLSQTDQALKECIINTDPVSIDSTGTTLHGCNKIHPMGLAPGSYTLLITVEDQFTGRSSRLAQAFEIGEPPKPGGRPK